MTSQRQASIRRFALLGVLVVTVIVDLTFLLVPTDFALGAACALVPGLVMFFTLHLRPIVKLPAAFGFALIAGLVQACAIVMLNW
jgi:hypothetical protein